MSSSVGTSLGEPNYMFQDMEKYQVSWDFLPAKETMDELNSLSDVISPESRMPINLINDQYYHQVTVSESGL